MSYVKESSNASMLFMREQRLSVDAEIKSRGSAAVNAFLGQKVSLSVLFA